MLNLRFILRYSINRAPESVINKLIITCSVVLCYRRIVKRY